MEFAANMKKTNFDRYLAEQMKDPAFAARFKQAGEAWDIALQLDALREQELAARGRATNRIAPSSVMNSHLTLRSRNERE